MTDRLVVLDGLRGVAAIGVMLFHLGLIAKPILVPGGYLAVDFFFMLSGFVICQAYERRFAAGLSVRAFLVQRAIRLWPVIALGAALGTAYLCAGWALKNGSVSGLFAIIATGGLNAFLIPKPPSVLGSDLSLFPGNWALWSLFFEALINIVWAIWLAGQSNRRIFTVTALSALALLAVGLTASSLNLGWTWPTFAGGLARVSFGFAAGCTLFRLREKIPEWARARSWLALPILLVVLVTPIYGVVHELIIVIIVMPAVVLLGASSTRALLLVPYRVVGNTSYALYGIHLPLTVMIGGVLRAVSPEVIDTGWPYLVAPALVLLGWATANHYETPARGWLVRVTTARRLAQG